MGESALNYAWPGLALQQKGVFVAFVLCCAVLCCAFFFLVPASFLIVLPNLPYAYLTSNRQQPQSAYPSGFNGDC
jgi:hypothetical protein